MNSAPTNTSVLEFASHESVKPYGKPVPERGNAFRNLGRASGASPSTLIICKIHPGLVVFSEFEQKTSTSLDGGSFGSDFGTRRPTPQGIHRFTFRAFRLGLRQYFIIV
jgi:hypothetical protein